MNKQLLLSFLGLSTVLLYLSGCGLFTTHELVFRDAFTLHGLIDSENVPIGQYRSPLDISLGVAEFKPWIPDAAPTFKIDVVVKNFGDNSVQLDLDRTGLYIPSQSSDQYRMRVDGFRRNLISLEPHVQETFRFEGMGGPIFEFRLFYIDPLVNDSIIEYRRVIVQESG